MKKLIIILTFIFIIITITIVGYSVVSANVTATEEKDDIAYQETKESYITPYGYTFDNPNIILDPYGISPLTALILFETESSYPVTITVLGKDENSTYTNTFESTNRHYIPVYGLYPNEINIIELECDNITKTIEIETSPLPIELSTVEVGDNNTNNLTFITSNNYPYALDNNNDIRWYLTKKYSKKIDYLENNHLLLSDESSSDNTYGLVEIDLLGKIYKQYLLDTPYLGNYEETDTSLFIETADILELDKQTGTILNIETNITTYNIQDLEYKSLLPLYTTSTHHQLIKTQKINLTKETKLSTKNIFLVGYKEIDNNYNNYNIEITKTKDNLQIIGNFTEEENSYLILDKFLDKKVYDLNKEHTIINKQGLTGKYSIYISINDTIYKTNNYIKF